MNQYYFGVILTIVIGFPSFNSDGVLQVNNELSEGSDCVSEEGLPGKCVDIHKCMQYVMFLRSNNKHPQTCTFNGNIPIVCCTDCEQVNDTTNVLVDRFGLHYFKTGKLAHDKCLEYVVDEPYPCNLFGGVQRYLDDESSCYGYSPTVILATAGGMNANRGEYPHMALLGYGDRIKTAQWLCGGTLISHRYVLTAGHCLSSNQVGPVKYIALGLLKRTDPDDMWQKYGIKKTIPHPEYKPPSKYNDIALLVTDKWVKFNHWVLPACLDVGDADGKVAMATGWGATGHRQGLADTLQTVTLKAYNAQECSKYYPIHRLLKRGYDHSSQMCYGDRDNINDTCEGDSGGPLQVRSVISSCVYVVIGVTSYGKSCGFVNSAGMYTRVSHYVPWIEQIVWKH